MRIARQTAKTALNSTDPSERNGANIPKEIPSGLIHDWIGAVFIASTTVDQVLPIMRDYGRYKDFYRPAVVASQACSRSKRTGTV